MADKIRLQELLERLDKTRPSLIIYENTWEAEQEMRRRIREMVQTLTKEGWLNGKRKGLKRALIPQKVREGLARI